MDYREHSPGPVLAGLVKAIWTLDAGGRAGEWIAHRATPDGCLEIIRRLAGRSRWDGEQPEAFVVGLSETPVAFEISGDARFAAVRLWPWAWHLLDDRPIDALRNRWLPARSHRIAAICEALPDFAAAEVLLVDGLRRAPPELGAMGEKLAQARSVAEMREATGMTARQLQRWFAIHVGLAPRRYLRLLRFQEAFEQVPGQASLADHAAAHGFADQAHMAREFRSLAGVPAKQARRAAKGPFLR